MQFLLNSRLRPGVTREQFINYVRENPDRESWDLVRKGVVQHWLWKIGDAPGLVVLVNCESLGEARQLAASADIVEQGLVEFEIDPIDLFMNSLWR